MASEVIAFPVNLRRNQNKYNAAYGKYYAEADSKEPLNLKGFASTFRSMASWWTTRWQCWYCRTS